MKLAVAALAVVTAVALASPASAEAVSCGQVIIQDTTLDSDLRCAESPALVIGADEITLDLGGHSIGGASEFAPPEVGIDDSAGHDGVTIENGSVSANTLAIRLIQADRTLIRNVAVDSHIEGIWMTDSHDNRIADSSVVATNIAVRLDNSYKNQVVRNSLSGYSGPAVLVTGNGNKIRANQVVGMGRLAVGISLYGNHNSVTDNVARGQSAGISLGGAANAILRNSVEGVSGYPAEGSYAGIFVREGSRNLVADNSVSDNEAFNSDFAEVYGLFVAEAAIGTRIVGNEANGNSHDGIDVRSPSTTLSQNIANDNGDLGIDAVLGVTDGGGNRASGNGNPLQCRNVFCGVDETPPVLTVPRAITVNATGPAGARVTYSASARDNLDPDPEVRCTPRSGRVFAIGTTRVTCIAADQAGNATSKGFRVVVKGAARQIADLIS